MKLIIFINMLLLIITVASPAAAIGESGVKDLLLKNNLNILPKFLNVNVGFGKVKNTEYYYIESNSRLFSSKKTVKVKLDEIHINDNDFIVKLSNNVLGAGYIKYFIENVDGGVFNDNDISDIVISSLMDNSKDVICDESSNLCHLTTSNHNNGARLILDYAQINKNPAKYKKCGFCFANKLNLAEIEIENNLAKNLAAEIRHYSPSLTNKEQTDRVRRIGSLVLAKWPLKLLGYDYSFVVYEDKSINATAIPTGQIFINSGLLNAIESDEELEAVLAHEVAHIELRHSLRSYHIATEKIGTQQGLAMVGAIAGAAAGAAASRNNSSVATIASAGAIGSLAGLIAAEIYYNGYTKEHEKEADELANMYFIKNNKNVNTLVMLFKKLMYTNLYKINNPDPSNISHPYLVERIDNINNFKYKSINRNYVTKDKNNNQLHIELLYEVDNKDTNIIYAYISDKTIFDNASEFMPKELHFKTESGDLKYQLNGNFLSVDQWGCIVKLIPKNSSSKLSNFTDVTYVEFDKDPSFGYPLEKKINMISGTLDSLL